MDDRVASPAATVAFQGQRPAGACVAVVVVTPPFLSVFAAVSSGTIRSSAEHGMPIALISVAMDVEVAIAAMNHVAYGSGRRASEPTGSSRTEGEWTDWRLLRLSPGHVAGASTWATRNGTIGVPFGIPTISAFARRLTDLLRPRALEAVAGDPAVTVAGPRHVLSNRDERTNRAQRVEDLYVFDPAADADWLFAMVEDASSDPDSALPTDRIARRRRPGGRA